MKKGKILSLLLTILCVLCLFSCGEQKVTYSTNTEHYDAITKTCKLTKDFSGKSFITDGLGLATVDAYTDGDTTRFKLLKEDEVIVIRYYEINTPESTSQVQKWGKAASNFTKECLSKAVEIVLESSTGGAAVTDSYGVRYLGYVWYRTSTTEDFKCLNLEIVENGFSTNKGINTSDYCYFSYFNQAEQFAKKVKTRLFSDLDDPLYSTDPIPFSLKEFEANRDLFYSTDAEAGAYVIFRGYLKSVYCSNSGYYTYTVAQYDQESGKEYEIDLAAGYSGASSSRMPLGDYYEIIGTVDYYYGRWQIKGINYLPVSTEGYTRLIRRNYYLTFNTDEKWITQTSTALYTDATVVSSEVNGEYLVIYATASARAKEGPSSTVENFTFKVKVGSSYNNEFTAGVQFTASGLKLNKNTNEITVVKLSDLAKK